MDIVRGGAPPPRSDDNDDDDGGLFARRAPGALLFNYLSRLQPQVYPLMEKPPK